MKIRAMYLRNVVARTTNKRELKGVQIVENLHKNVSFLHHDDCRMRLFTLA